jgi:hypothetical protein
VRAENAAGGHFQHPARSGYLWLRGRSDFGLGLKRDWFSLGSDTPYIEEDGDEHVTQDVDA